MKVTINNKNKVFKGFFTACDAVSATIGPEGRLAIIQNDLGTAVPTKDGVTVARSIFIKENEENIGVFFAKQAALKTLVVSGDSTSTTLVFAKSLIQNTLKRNWLKKEYYFNSRVKEGMEIGIKEVSNSIKSLSKKADSQDIHNIARISANNNSEIADIVTQAYEAVGENGVIDVRESQESSVTTVKITNGMTFNKGWKSPLLISDDKTGVWEAEDVNIILFEGIISPSNAQQISDVVTTIQKEPILIICERIESDVEDNIVNNFQRGLLNICVVEAPYFAAERATFFKDLALYTSGESHVQGISEGFKVGKADKVIIEKEMTSIIQNEAPQEVKDLAQELKKQPTNDYLKKRISNLEGKAAIITIGAITDMEAQELKDRVDDSVCAVKSALREGVIAGGGCSLVYISGTMNKQFENKDIQFGYNIIKKSLSAPYNKILENAKIPAKKYRKHSEKTYGIGYNVKNHKVENLLEQGILDSSKSIRVALENSKSVVSLLLDTAVVISHDRVI